MYSRDNVPKVENKSYIINLNKQDESGSHWVMIYNKLPEICIYFDSFAVSPPFEIEKRLRFKGKDTIYNSYRIQHLESIMCGYFCIYFIEELDKQRQFVDILADFSNLDFAANDKIISKLII